jgi:hypothetical protein
MNIDSKEIEKILDKDIPPYLALGQIKKAITPKPTFMRGEIGEASYDGNIWYPASYYGYHPKNGRNNYTVGVDGYLEYRPYFRKLDSLPIAPIEHDSPDRPEGLKDGDVAAIHYKNHTTNFFQTIKVMEVRWAEVDKYIKVHFVGEL